jgi:hypothetical protein
MLPLFGFSHLVLIPDYLRTFPGSQFKFIGVVPKCTRPIESAVHGSFQASVAKAVAGTIRCKEIEGFESNHSI